MFTFENPNTPIIAHETVVTYPVLGGYQYRVLSADYVYVVRDDRGEVVARVSQTGSPFGGFDWAEGVEMVETAIKKDAAIRSVREAAERLRVCESEEFLAMDYDDDVAAYDAAHGIN